MTKRVHVRDGLRAQSRVRMHTLQDAVDVILQRLPLYVRAPTLLLHRFRLLAALDHLALLALLQDSFILQLWGQSCSKNLARGDTTC